MGAAVPPGSVVDEQEEGPPAILATLRWHWGLNDGPGRCLPHQTHTLVPDASFSSLFTYCLLRPSGIKQGELSERKHESGDGG
jgi:hypothetical protein